MIQCCDKDGGHARDEPQRTPEREGAGVIGSAFRQLAIWGGLALLLYAVVGYRLLAPADAPTPRTATATPSAPAPQQTRSASPNALVFRANRQGHVELDAVVNGSPVRFLVDTGATMVVLSMRDAAAAGISRTSLDFNIRTSTANGVGRAAAVRLRELRIGQFSVSDVPAAVVENLQVSLLGQTFLKRLDSYEMRDGVLTLYWN
jgi:aspartyl protease family protein